MTEKDKRAAAEDFDFAAAAAKEPTGLQEHLADWIIEKCGLTFASKAAEAAFRKGVQLSTTLRMKHQASEENQERNAELKAAREAAAEEAEAPAPKAAPAKKAAGKKAAPAPVAEEAPKTKKVKKATASAPTTKAPF